jgi:class 3 adenylate cyclase/trans-aconitate methyltransferase
MVSEPDEYLNDRVSVLFLDLRNFTLLLDNHETAVVTEMLDYFFRSVGDTIAEHNGKVDKIVGDGLMAVFGGEQPGADAVQAAIDIYQEVVPKTESEKAFNSIDIGIGVSTGKAQQTAIAGFDSTVVGRCVNIAARLQGLCKEYGTSILVDEATYTDFDGETLSERYVSRLIPNQSLRGIRRAVNAYHICDTSRLGTEYINLFNEGIKKYLNQNYDAALNAFTEAYTKDERYADQILLNDFTNDCLNNLDDDRALFRNPDRYEKHSTTQQQQAVQLESYIQQFTMTRDFQPEFILDVGCGTGAVTESLARTYPDASIVAIDPSRESIAKARTDHNPEDADITYINSRIEDYCPEEEWDQYDLVFSNSAMHWVEEQHEAYANIRRLIHDDGLLAIHQGHEGTYKQLHDVTVELLEDFDYTDYFDELSPPLDLTYYTKDGMDDLLRRHDFKPKRTKLDDDTAPETIIEDFAEASLNAYCERLESDSQREVFRERFKQRANEQLESEDVTVRRIYTLAVPD